MTLGRKHSIAKSLPLRYESSRFCLDGQRLKVLSGATYGASGTEYRTEIESFQRVKASGSPLNFTVEDKTGLIREYGKTADSRIEAAGFDALEAFDLGSVLGARGAVRTAAVRRRLPGTE